MDEPTEQTGGGQGDGSKTPNWGLGIALGIALGAGLGVALGNPAIGIGVGIALGVAFAYAFAGRPWRRDGDDGAADGHSGDDDPAGS